MNVKKIRARYNKGNEIKAQFDSLPSPVRTWIQECRQALAIYSAGSNNTSAISPAIALPSGDGVHHIEIMVADGDMRYFSHPSDGKVTWTGLLADIGDDSALATQEFLNYAASRKPMAGIFRVESGEPESTVLGRLRVAKQVGAMSGPRFTLAVLFKGHSLSAVHQCIKSLFPDKSATCFGAIVTVDPAGDITRECTHPLHDNAEYIFYCQCTEDHKVRETVLSQRVFGGNSMAWHVCPARKKREGFRADELNPVVPFRIWYDVMNDRFKLHRSPNFLLC
jgi:hypothetical protein